MEHVINQKRRGLYRTERCCNGPYLFTATALIGNDTHDVHRVHRAIRGSIVDVVFSEPRDGGIWGHNRRGV